MKVEFLKQFSKDLDDVPNDAIRHTIVRVIEEVEGAASLKGIRNLKKLKGYRTAYRVRVADYRIGLLIEGGVVQFARFLHRSEIYRLFP